MFRCWLIPAILTPLMFSQTAFSQTLPAFQWVKEVDSTGGDSFAGLGVDAGGNTYVAGSTYSASFPVKSAVQPHIASAGLYRIDGPGSAYAALGLSSASFVAIDPQQPNTIYAISGNAVMRSMDAGATFTTLSIPAQEPVSVAIDPSNDQVIYVGAWDRGLLKSLDGGVTWAASNGSLLGSFLFSPVWIDPHNPNVLFGDALGNFMRSADGGATWQTLLSQTNVVSVSFDSAVPGLLYGVTAPNGAFVSTDDGVTLSTLTIPQEFGAILPDPNHPGRLVASSQGGIFESGDSGATWTLALPLNFLDNLNVFAADWTNGYLYTGNQYVVRITADLQTVTPVGPAAVSYIASMAAANGHVYLAVPATHDVYVTKLDASGNIVYSTFFGGTADDVATAMTVDRAGDVYVTGTTTSLDFPVTKGTYAATGGSFLFKLNPDGSVAYSTYFAPGGNSPTAIAIDSSGAAYLVGSSSGTLPVTPGAYQSQCNCSPISTGFSNPAPANGVTSDRVSPNLTIFRSSGFVSKFDPAGATLIYSTYIAGPVDFAAAITQLAVASDGTTYVAGQSGLYHLKATGTALLGSITSGTLAIEALAVAPDGGLMVAGTANSFPATPGTFQPSITVPPQLPGQGGFLPRSVIAKYDAQLANVQAATYFGYARTYNRIVFDAAGNVYLGGQTAPQGLPTRTPLQGGFAYSTGFLSELTGDLSQLLFSTYLGDTDVFSVAGVAPKSDGSVVIGGVTGLSGATISGPYDLWVNALALAPPPPLRVDSVVSAASLLDGPISAGETIVVEGAGFGGNAQLTIGGVPVPALSQTSTSITATVPQTVTAAAAVQVSSGGASSNSVLVSVAATAPAVFSQNGSGFGQGYILNNDGTLNTPANPAKPGEAITVFATGVGPVSFTQGYAVTQYPVYVYIDGFFADGIEAFMSAVPGLPGNVYQIQVFVPDPALLSANPNLKGFVFPPLVGVDIDVNGAASQSGISFSISQ